MDAKTSARPLQERALDLKAATLRYLVREGEAPTLVLVHGFGGAGANWDALLPHLDSRRRLIVPDLPGHGLSGTATQLVVTLPDGSTLHSPPPPHAAAGESALDREQVLFATAGRA